MENVRLLSLAEVRDLYGSKRVNKGLKDYLDLYFAYRDEAYFTDPINHHYLFFSYQIKGELAGLIGIEECPSSDFFYISPLFTIEEYRGKGIGSDLIRYSLDIAKVLDHKRVFLQCDKELIPFYERLGFSVDSGSKMIHRVRD